MATLTSNLSEQNAPSSAIKSKWQACEEIASAVATGRVGDIVSKHEKLILQYYEDVQRQAADSFKAAKRVSYVGFAVLILTWLYTLGFDLVGLLPGSHLSQLGSKSAISTGVISGVLIEFIAGVNFWLYAKASKQFGAFHICLERTHRYLVAYKIAEETGSRREIVLENIACIMAKAPMITGRDIDQTSAGVGALHSTGAP